jgi:hypothetical protein
MKDLIYWSILVSALIIMSTAASQPEAKTPIANLMIKADMPLSPSEDQKTNAELYLINIYNTINGKNLNATIFSTQDFIDSHARLRLTDIGMTSGFELAMSGNHSNEKLSKESLETQNSILKRSMSYVEACRVCGKNEITVKGFMPQSFDQNQDTYNVLDDLGIQYDAGFQAGLLYAPGHENDVWPYLVEGHKFYAVPVSTYTLSGKNVVLDDSYFKDNGLSASQWYDALVGKFDEIQGKDEPLVFSITTSISGSGDYLDALDKFISYATSKDASFVTSKQLVDMAKTGLRDVSALPSTTNASAACPTCGQSNTNVTIMPVSKNNTEAAAA